ncbi:MAG TPA: hypothetical protein ENH28_00720 [Euryarchaeota archaeon]|nr:hypothetical protein [Euryarchaeota archaeon]
MEENVNRPKMKDLSRKRVVKILDEIFDMVKIFYKSGGSDYHIVIAKLKEEGWITTKNPTIFQNRSNYKGWIVFCQPLQLKERTNYTVWACKKGDFNIKVYPSKRI